MPVEAILERLVAPLAQQAPVLLLVADGLSYSIFRELCEDLEALGWDGSMWPGRHWRRVLRPCRRSPR